MCAVIGALVWNITTPDALKEVNSIIDHIMTASVQRGRDGRGFMLNSSSELEPLFLRDTARADDQQQANTDYPYVTDLCSSAVYLSNLRAEPTSEYVKDKQLIDQQPYVVAPWAIVHNGTIANDKALRTYAHPTKIDSAAVAEVLASVTLDEAPDLMETFWHFYSGVAQLKGSYAILANYLAQCNQLHVAVNYRPVWYIETPYGVFFASARDYLPEQYAPRMVQPYTAMNFQWNGEELETLTVPLRVKSHRSKALVVCSGGLDSVVAAAYAQKALGYEIELIHFQYGCRAEDPEVHAVQQVGEALGVKTTLFPLPVYKKEDSPLLNSDSAVAGGEAGAEFAHEWVPARNLLLLSVATAYAEANGFDTIVLGNNLEEAGAYPDNEPEFIARFNDLLPFAVGDGKFMEVIMPVGNLMKHEIVALGQTVGAPLHLTWSCYRAGEQHCGTCGPCYMRRIAFQINNTPEVITYEKEQPL